MAARWLGLHRFVGLGAALLCFLVAIPAGIWSAHARGGELRIEGRALVQERGGERDLRLELDRARWTPMVWARGMTGVRIGLLVVVDDGARRLSIGAADSSLASGPLAESVEVTSVPPSVRVSGESLRALIDHLEGSGVPRARGG